MSGNIVKSYYGRLQGIDIDLEGQVQHYKSYWEKQKMESLQQKMKEFALYHIGDTVLFTYREGFVSKRQEDQYNKEVCQARGIVTQKQEINFWIRVKLLEGCDPKAIISYYSHNTTVHHKATGKLEKIKKRVIEHLSVEKETWFNYETWELMD